MQFISLDYGLFFPLAVLVYYAAPAHQRWAVLVAVSAAFLAWAGVAALAIAIGLAVVNYFLGIAIEKHADTRRASFLLLLALFCNVGVLAFFKYGGLFDYGSEFGTGLDGMGVFFGASATSSHWAPLLPLGISYYVFQLISYDLEIYWGRAPAARHLGHLVASILFFPKLVAGPIERPHHFIPQLAAAKPFSAEDITIGLKLIGWGLFKKCVIADRMALIVNPVFETPHDYSGLALLIMIVLYPLQVYNDFSGYTDMALGSARCLGLEICPNFNHPFSARSLTDFWRRWHISLSSWTNDYIFRPLSAYALLNTSRRKTGLFFSITSAFFVLGLWHGATWNFVLFGLMHGVAVSFEALTQRSRARLWLWAKLPERVADRLANVATLTFYALSCVVFATGSIGDAVYMLGRAFGGVDSFTRGDVSAFQDHTYRLAVLAMIAVVLLAVRRMSVGTSISEWLSTKSLWWRWSAYYAVIAAIFVLGEFDVKDFVYVQF
jgi:D-alanyl-lipoteichoic acid acyltransferase DltB (MBOAT superfamily)